MPRMSWMGIPVESTSRLRPRQDKAAAAGLAERLRNEIGDGLFRGFRVGRRRCCVDAVLACGGIATAVLFSRESEQGHCLALDKLSSLGRGFGVHLHL